MDGGNTIIELLERIERATLTNKPILTVENLTAYTGYSKYTIHRLTSKRLIPHYKREGRLFFKRDEIDSWLLADKVKTQEEIAQEAETYCALNKH